MPQSDSNFSKEDKTLSECVQDFLIYLGGIKSFSENTVLAYANNLSYLEECVSNGKETKICDISENDLRFAVGTLIRSKKQVASVNQFISSVRGLFSYCKKFGIIQKNPASTIHVLKSPKKLPSYLSKTEASQICLQPEEHELLWEKRDQALFLMLLSSGSRVSELSALRFRDLSFDKSSAIVHGKGSKERRIFFSKEAVCKFEEYLEDRKIRYNKTKFEPTDPLFVNQSGTKLTSRGIRYIVSRYSSEKEGTGKNISPHAFRHTFATTMLNNGADIRVVQEMLGHSSISTTQHYTHLTRESIQKSYNLAHPHSGEKK